MAKFRVGYGVVAWLFCVIPLQAQTSVEKELKALRAQRDEGARTATESVDRRYQQDLEKMLRFAMQGKDPDAVLKIRGALSTLPEEATKQLVGNWSLRASTGYATELTFRADGTGHRSDFGEFKWYITNAILYLETPKVFSDQFQLPIVENKLRGLNGAGNTLSLSRK